MRPQVSSFDQQPIELRAKSKPQGRRILPTPESDDENPNPSPSISVEKVLANGDFYSGGFHNNAPHGGGKYLWADGCMYEGEWRRGKASGRGKFSWPSGATFEGHFRSGRIEGFGTFTGSDGDTYRGSWSNDRKHGYGSKSYANGDFYEGTWRRNLQDGHGRYIWRNGNQYIGEWKSGVISGRGVLIWANGNRYDGQWENGAPKGNGVFTWPDGSCYIGNWSKQALNGTFYPATTAAGMRKRSSVDGEKNFPRICIWESDGDAGDITCDIVDALEVYKDGSVMEFGKEEVMKIVRSPGCFHGGEAKKPGLTISKGHKNYDLMLNLQLGIRYSVGKQASTQMRELRPGDFDPREKFWTRFPPEGSKITPPHQSVEFRWKDYCPMVFRYIFNWFWFDFTMILLCSWY